MEDDLPTEYDVVIVGTGMTESIIAAAASRVGKKVLHLDSNEYYGGLWASFNFDGLQKWMEECREPKEPETTDVPPEFVKEGEKIVPAGNKPPAVQNVEEKWYILEDVSEWSSQAWSKETQTDTEGGPGHVGAEDTQTAAGCEPWSQARVRREYRKFNLDLAPKLLFARGSLVELLISSNIARYAEFRSVTRVLTWLDGRLQPVPCSRADVFATQHVSVVEKRMLMKLLTACVEQEDSLKEFEDFADKPFVEYLKWKKLTPNLLHYVLYAIAMSTESTPCTEGVERTRRFLNSLGRYGNTPFLWPMYGSGELPQCFCRLCAVFGGLYHLKRSVDALLVGPDERCCAVVSGGQRLVSAHVVMGTGYAPTSIMGPSSVPGLSRAILLTDRSLLPTDKEALTLLQFPPIDGVSEPVTVLEVGPATNACPPGLYVVHMTCRQRKTAREDLQGVVDKLMRAVPTDKPGIHQDSQSTQTCAAEEIVPPEQQQPPLPPQVLWSLYFNCPDTSQQDLAVNSPANVFLCSGPDLDLDFEFAVQQAKDIFAKMYPDCEFLPRAPDPEEVVLESEDSAVDTAPDAADEEQKAAEPTVA